MRWTRLRAIFSTVRDIIWGFKTLNISGSLRQIEVDTEECIGFIPFRYTVGTIQVL